MKLKFVMIAGILVVIGLTVMTFVNYRRLAVPEPAPDSKTPAGASLSLSGFRHTATSNGKTQWQIQAASAHFLDAPGQAVLKNLELTFFLKNGEQLVLTANEGRLETATNHIVITDNIVVNHKNGKITTERIEYRHDRRVLHSNTPVTIDGPFYRLTADSVTVDLESNKILFEGRVNGRFREGTLK